MSTHRGSRGPSVVYGSLTAAMIVLFGTLTLTAAAPPPPAIAEFAPEAVRQITDAPEEQQQLAVRGPGQGPGGEADDAASPDAATDASTPSAVPTVSPLPIHRVARAHTCVGSPPRQTEDPQSPPCVAFYQGKLLGATTRGVTAEEIRIVIPCNPAPGQEIGTCAQDGSPDIKAFTAFFNERFEFYGRKLRVIRYNITTPQTVTNMIADAQAIEALEPFVVMDYFAGRPDPTGQNAIFFRELARRKILNIQGLQLEQGTSNVTQAELQAQAPYSWTYQPTADMVLTSIGDVICTNLVGRKPWFDVEQNPTLPEPEVRRFGIAVPEVPDSSANLDITPLTRRMDKCDAPYQTQSFRPTNDGSGQTHGADALVTKFHQDGVTTIVGLAFANNLIAKFMVPATNQAYYPEWIVSNIYGTDAMTHALNSATNQQKQQMFGPRSDNRAVPGVKNYFVQAVKEYDPNYTGASRRGFYQAYMLLASGVQMAGPNLTPQTFQQAMYDTNWPGNATAKGPPEWHSKVEFGPGDHTMQGDFGFQHNNPNERNNDFPAQTGAYCNVERGIRFAPGELDRVLRFYKAGQGQGTDPCYD